jgi:hypothetical protein
MEQATDYIWAAWRSPLPIQDLGPVEEYDEYEFDEYEFPIGEADEGEVADETQQRGSAQLHASPEQA